MLYIQRLLVLLLFMGLSSASYSQSFRAPLLQGKTLSGLPADSNYYKDKLTMLSFFYIGCMPCMKEILVLNRLKDHFAGRPLQILAVAPHNARQLREWNTKELTSLYKSEPIRYDILPECSDSTLDRPGFAPLCYTLSRQFGVNSYPTSVFVNGKGEILLNVEGFPMRENPEETFQEMRKMIEGFLH